MGRWNRNCLPLTAGISAALLSSCATPPAGETELGAQARCAALAGNVANAPVDGPVDGLVVTASSWQQPGTTVPSRGGADIALPGHCLVEGHYAEREGLIGGTYSIGFRMRMPEDWNGRFFFQGGGGSNGVVGDATGPNGGGNTLALVRGYAVITQDSGHDNDTNNVFDHQGELVFGFDPQARRNYGHASLKPTYDLGRHLLRSFYGRDSDHEIFWGCSKGGQEGMAFAQRYPDAFDGIVAMAPGMSLPRAAVAEAWDTQAFAGVIQARGENPSVDGLRSLFSASQFALVRQATLAACDGLDGIEDGIVATIGQCSTALVEPELRQRQCAADSGSDCLEAAQVDALVAVMDGAHNSAGEPLYAPWAWDGGIGEPGWAMWKVGLEQGPPALNILLGGGSLAAVFTTPPTALPFDPDSILAWQMAFDFNRDAPAIYAAQPPFTTSAWQDIGMRSSDLSAFRANGGRLIVPHGTSDPVFSVLDTIAWWQAVDTASGGDAEDFVRVFPVPGMNHCAGGPATGEFDTLSALEAWVLEGEAPDAIPARAGRNTPWPGREMPLCPYPQIALPAEGGTYRCGHQDGSPG